MDNSHPKKFATRDIFVLTSLAALAMLLVGFVSTARADDAMDAVKKRLAERYPQIRAAKDAGKIGETFAGLVEAVDPKSVSDADKKLVEDENKDRQQAYALLAADAKTSADVVAERAGAHNFNVAHPGDYLKDKDGPWKRKEAPTTKPG